MRIRRLAVPVLAATLALSTQAAPATAFPAFPAFPGFPGSSVAGLPTVPATSSASGMQQALLDETNRYRASQGLAPLAPHPTLDGVAQSWSETMAQQRTLRHNPDYRGAYPAAWRQAAENVGMFSREVAARDMLQAWINSPSHRQHLDNPNFTHIGVGWAVSAHGEVYATQNFASF